MVRTIGFIGLGTMGAPMATNIHNAGYSLGVFNRSPEKTKPFRKEGIPVYESSGELTAESDVIIIMVTGPDALSEVLQTENGVLEELTPDSIVINMSTVSHQATMRAADLVASHNGEFLDIPVSGTRKPAEDGTLVVLAGGEEDTVHELTPLLKTMGKEIIYCGALGQGTNMKLMINLLLGAMMQGFAEALTLGKKLHLDPEAMMKTIDSGGLSSVFFTAKGQAIRQANFTKNFPVDLMLKDLNLVLEAGGENGVPLPQTSVTREMFSAARGAGYGDQDMAAVIKVLEKIAGVEVRD